jgi:hypothetical protein
VLERRRIVLRPEINRRLIISMLLSREFVATGPESSSLSALLVDHFVLSKRGTEEQGGS